jgi:acetylornithine/succinyldiaminopimelate/putrescine aminotransferase
LPPATNGGDPIDNRLHAAGVLTIPAGTQIIRLLPPLNLKPQEAGEGIAKIEEVVKSLA